MIRLLIINCIFILALIVSVWCVYKPGLSGGLMFDDFANLEIVKHLGGVDSSNKLVAYLLENDAGPLKRPISMLSFILDDQHWPMSSYRLKRTNILLHSVNVLLVFWFCLVFLGALKCRKESGHALSVNSESDGKNLLLYSFLISLVWALNPMQVSTVLYVIQRMTILSSMFVLIGLIVNLKFLLYVRGGGCNEKHYVKYITVFVVSLGFGLFSKENAILLCLFCWLISNSFVFEGGFQNNDGEKFWLRYKLAFFVAPSLLLFFYMLFISLSPGSFEMREYNVYERMLTQFRIIFIYISSIVFSSPFELGLLKGESIEYSVSLFEPISTFVSFVAIIMIIIFSVKYRKKYPVVVFGVFFFFLGHALESTILPLELYFEHRNYLAQLGVWISLFGLFSYLLSTKFRNIAVIVFFVLPLLYALVSFRVSLWWGDSLKLSEIWYEKYPVFRTASRLAVEYDKIGRKDLSLLLMKQQVEKEPFSMSANLALDYYSCYVGGVGYEFNDEKYDEITLLGKFDLSWMRVFSKIYEDYSNQKQCDGVGAESLYRILELSLRVDSNMVKHPVVHSQANLHAAKLSRDSGNLSKTIGHLNKVCEIRCNATIRHAQAYYLYTAGLYDEAVYYLNQSKEELGMSDAYKYPYLKSKIEKLEGWIHQRNIN